MCPWSWPRPALKSRSISGAGPRRVAWCRCPSINVRSVRLEPDRGDDMAYPDDRKYTNDHEWIRVAGDTAEVGVTDYAQKQLGEVVYVELPEVGAKVTAAQPFGSIES